MGDNWIQNSLILALLLFISGAIINYIIGLGLDLFGLDISFVNDLGFLLVAYIVGFFYTKKIGQIMPKGLRFKTVGLFFVLYLIATFAITYFITQGEFMVLLFAVGFSSIMLIIECLVIYWFLGFGGKTYLKSANKANVAQQQTRYQ
jgi:hypothetical protein